METKLERIAEISANSPGPEFTSLYHLINKEMLLQCHKELDGNKAVGVDEITKKEYGRNLEQNIDDLVERLKRKSYKGDLERMKKSGFFRKSEYVYDEYNDAYICPGNHFLHYSTTNRDGYREYKSCGHICEKCEYLSQCTERRVG